MFAVQVCGQAHVAGGAVEEVVPPPDPADAAAGAVELLLVIIVEQLALVAKVLSKLGVAVDACVGDVLADAAGGADHLEDVVPLQDVVLGGVVAEAAAVGLLAARCLKMKEENNLFVLVL